MYACHFQKWKIEKGQAEICRTLTPADRKSSKEAKAENANLQKEATIYASQGCGIQERLTLKTKRVCRCCCDNRLANITQQIAYQGETHWLEKGWP